MEGKLPLDEIIKKCSSIMAAHDDKTLYTDIGHQYRLERYINTLAKEENLSAEEHDFLIAAKWLEGVIQAENPIKEIDFDKSSVYARQRTESLCTELNIDRNQTEALSKFVANIRPDRTPDSKLDQIYNDATWIDFATVKGRDYLKRYYQQLILQGYDIERLGWYDVIINYLGTGQFYTEYARINYDKKLRKLVKNLLKEKEELEQRQDLVLKQQLDISEKEMKKLKKALTGAKKRDDRAIQTLFRVTLRNHYTLNQMVDRKANIMITVNAIILSLLLGGVIKSEVEQDIVRAIPLIVLTLACVVSIFFSILAIRPNKTQGDFTEEEIRNRQGNLLFFGNFHNMHVRDFEWAFMQMLNDSDYLYGSMIRDYYFLGVSLNKKYKDLRKSLNVFMFGFIGAVVLNLIFRLLLV